ncbi:hypothetical protein KSC_105340 [Ktedonobacter sp. SOSP1-52]|nr:hypothetical protein KSC_105340 [Ktedonobacter sp. SOSP1-52]
MQAPSPSPLAPPGGLWVAIETRWFEKRRFNGCLLQMVETGLTGDVLRFAMQGETPATRGDAPL